MLALRLLWTAVWLCMQHNTFNLGFDTHRMSALANPLPYMLSSEYMTLDADSAHSQQYTALHLLDMIWPSQCKISCAVFAHVA